MIHEDRQKLSPKTLDLKRAIDSLEKEHASMLVEWIRRNDSEFAHELKDYLFTEKPVTEIEEKA